MRFFLASCLSLFSFVIFSQTATISGKIIDDATDLGVPFATIQVKDTDKGTTADIEGNFSISAEKNQVLIVRMVGYIDQEFLVNNSTTSQFKKTDIFNIFKKVFFMYFPTT